MKQIGPPTKAQALHAIRCECRKARKAMLSAKDHNGRRIVGKTIRNHPKQAADLRG